ncbi:hypothetical protein BT93_J1581 [Corymbia citriodora subsp. variegata]|nr:hypothetical protein BT93_J1581 [Corymbia citriodora subsp. variegata]
MRECWIIQIPNEDVEHEGIHSPHTAIEKVG